MLVDEHMGYRGTGWKLLVPYFAGGFQQLVAFVAPIARGYLAEIDSAPGLPCAGLCSTQSLRARTIVHAGQERHACCRVGVVKGAQSGLFPVAVGLFNASPSWCAHSWIQCKRDRLVSAKVIENLDKVPRSEIATSGSSGAEVVVDGDTSVGTVAVRR